MDWVGVADQFNSRNLLRARPRTWGDDHVVEGPMPRQQRPPVAPALVVVHDQGRRAPVHLGEVVGQVVRVRVVVVDEQRA